LDIKGVDEAQNIPDNSLTALNIPFSYEIVSMWVREDKSKIQEFDCEVEVFNPSGYSVFKFPQKITMGIGIRRIRTRLQVQGIIISLAGDYIFKVKIKPNKTSKFITVAELPLEVNLSKEVMHKFKT
jgi:hypothetical protein